MDDSTKDTLVKTIAGSMATVILTTPYDFTISAHPTRYLQRLVEKLTQDLKLSQKASQQLLETECKREQTSASLKLLQPRYSSLVVRTKALQAQVGEDAGQGM